ncbi:MAG: FHA domain-containing protein [Phototrophicaceae bacterium]
MAYGRLDVFGQDQQHPDSHLLQEPNISIGRSSGATIQFDTDTISRYHVGISYENGMVMLADMGSQNGTFVDGVRVNEDESMVLQGGEEIRIGNLRMVFHLLETPETHLSATTLESSETQPLNQSGDAPFTISIQPPPIAIPPSSNIAAELTIVNPTQEAIPCVVEVSGPPAEWMRVNRPRFTVDPEQTTRVLITFRPPRLPSATPGEYTVRLVVRHAEDAHAFREVLTKLHVLPYHGFGAQLERRVIQHGETFRLHIHNQGNSKLPIDFHLAERFNSSIALQNKGSGELTLKAGERAVIEGTVQSKKRPLLGKPITLPYQLVIHSLDAAGFTIAVQGKVIRHAIVPSAVAYGLAGLLAGLLVVWGIINGIMSRPEPTLTVALSSTNIIRGNALEIVWEAQDIKNIDVFMEGVAIREDIDPATTNLFLDTTLFPERGLLRLVGENGSRTAQVEQIIRIIEPMTIVAFDVQPDPLMRNVTANLTLQWEVTYAKFVQINGLEALTGVTSPGRLQPTDSNTVAGIPSGDLELTLYAEDEFGNSIEEPLSVVVIDPTCTPLDETVTLHDGPSEYNLPIALIPQQTVVVVDARDQSGKWIRAQLSGGVRGWGEAALLNCDERFDTADLRIELDVIAPPATPTHTPLPTLPPATSAPVDPTVTPAPNQLLTPSPTTSG